MAQLNARGGWDITDAEAAEVIRLSSGDGESGGEATRDVLVWRKLGEEPTRYRDAYLQADDPTVLIRQKVDGCWTTVAVWAPGTYEHAAYENVRPQASPAPDA